MTDISNKWTIETFPIQNHTCSCCDDQFQLALGMIQDDQGAELALYAANLTLSTKPREVRLFVTFKNKKNAKPRVLVVSLVLRMVRSRIVTSAVTDTQNPLGKAMTREQVLASPLKAQIFEIADFIAENDPHVRTFLEEGATMQSSEGM